jgi:hypothetical protein
LTHAVRWESGKATFTTTRGAAATSAAPTRTAPVSEHTFTSGVPVPGDEKVRINFYDFQRGPQRLRHDAEVVIERFTYTP